MNRDIKRLRHAQKSVKYYEKLSDKRPLTTNEMQQKYLWESVIEEEYSKPVIL